jgi:hypothetical protein
LTFATTLSETACVSPTGPVLRRRPLRRSCRRAAARPADRPAVDHRHQPILPNPIPAAADGRGVEGALAQSRFFILLASAEAASSTWCGKEVSYWQEHKSIS